MDALVITEFTGRKPRGCDGTQREGEWIFEYTDEGRWIDVDSLLPLQWETPVDAFAFRYDPTIAITRPDGIVPPACVP